VRVRSVKGDGDARSAWPTRGFRRNARELDERGGGIGIWDGLRAWFTQTVLVCQGTTTTTGASLREVSRWLNDPAI
jgi:hypothetical protein